MNPTPASANPWAAWIGLDWGDQTHALALATPGGGAVEKETLVNTPEALQGWLQKLAARFQGRPVALTLEANRGPLLHVFAQYAWLQVHPVNPATSARFRRAFTVSGAKDDLPDAVVLLELAQFHLHKLRVWEPEDEATRRIDALTRARRDAVDQRTQCANQLTNLLKSYYPQALTLAGGDLSSPIALDFLARWPDLLALKAARPATVRAFYDQHNVRRPELVDQRVASIATAVAWTTDDVVLSTARLELQLLLAQSKAFHKAIAQFEKEMAAAFKNHPEADLFRDLPGAGAALAPRLLVAFGTDRTRYPAAAHLQKFAGLAPVREKSGSQLWTHWRWQAPIFLRQTFVEWAGQTVVWCDWAKRYYERKKAAGKKHHVILRALAFKWIAILWKCWQTRVPYNEAVYLAALQKRQSPNLPLAHSA